MSSAELAAVAGVLLFAGAAQSLSGFGFSLISVPLLAAVLDPRHAVVIATCVGLLVSTLLLLRSRAHIHWPLVRHLLFGAVLGMPLGLLVLLGLPREVLQVVIAVAVLVATFLIARNVRLPVHTRRGEIGAGVVAGILTTSTSTNGPPLAITLQAKGMPPAAFRATVSAVFVAAGAMSTTIFASAGQVDAVVGRSLLVGVPAVAAGFAIGDVVFHRIDPSRFRGIVLGMLVTGALVSLANVLL